MYHFYMKKIYCAVGMYQSELKKIFFLALYKKRSFVVAFAECYLPFVLSCYLYTCKIT